MAKQDYIPGTLGELLEWLINYRDTLPTYAATLGLNPAEVPAQVAFCNALIAKINANYAAQADAETARAALDTQKVTSITGIRKLAQQIKKNNAYTVAMGEELKIIGPDDSIDINTAQPKLKAKKVENGWELSFTLHGFFDSVKIYRQRPSQSRQFIAIDTSSPYVDAEPMVNDTKYTAYFMLGDESVGIESDPVVIKL